MHEAPARKVRKAPAKRKHPDSNIVEQQLPASQASVKRKEQGGPADRDARRAREQLVGDVVPAAAIPSFPPEAEIFF